MKKGEDVKLQFGYSTMFSIKSFTTLTNVLCGSKNIGDIIGLFYAHLLYKQSSIDDNLRAP